MAIIPWCGKWGGIRCEGLDQWQWLKFSTYTVVFAIEIPQNSSNHSKLLKEVGGTTVKRRLFEVVYLDLLPNRALLSR